MDNTPGCASYIHHSVTDYHDTISAAPLVNGTGVVGIAPPRPPLLFAGSTGFNTFSQPPVQYEQPQGIRGVVSHHGAPFAVTQHPQGRPLAVPSGFGHRPPNPALQHRSTHQSHQLRHVRSARPSPVPHQSHSAGFRPAFAPQAPTNAAYPHPTPRNDNHHQRPQLRGDLPNSFPRPNYVPPQYHHGPAPTPGFFPLPPQYQVIDGQWRDEAIHPTVLERRPTATDPVVHYGTTFYDVPADVKINGED
jgi:hypothetical protein